MAEDVVGIAFDPEHLLALAHFHADAAMGLTQRALALHNARPVDWHPHVAHVATLDLWGGFHHGSAISGHRAAGAATAQRP